MPDVGETFDRFVLEAELGAGGMGQVFRAFDTRLHRRIALKIVRPDSSANAAQRAEAKARMLREARAAAAFDHPNAVAVFDFGEVGEESFIAMELVSGETLRRFVGDASVASATKLRWLVDVAHALAAAHHAGLVHRDIKPENVMVRGDGRVTVLDFGIARRTAAEVDKNGPTHVAGAIQTLTLEGAIVGTPLYMAPEQIEAEPVDGRADQFAFGVMAYELLAGAPPFTASGTMALMAAVLTQTPPPLRSVASDVPEDVELAVARALSKKAIDRFPRMEEVIALLEPHAQPSQPASLPRVAVSAQPSRPPEAGPSTGAAVVVEPRASRRGRRRIGAAIAGVLLVVACGAAAARALVHRSPRHAPAAAREVPLPAATTMIDLPKPVTANAAALAAYNAALQADHDGSNYAARRGYEQALGSDPALSVAHLRLAKLLVLGSPTQARAHLQKATTSRAALSERDRAVLDAFEPAIARDPADHAASERGLLAATSRFPGDAELWLLLGVSRYRLGRFSDAASAVDRAIALDDKYATAWHMKAILETIAGTRENALTALTRCIDAAPNGASRCRELRVSITAQDGRCADVEGDARQLVSMDPDGGRGYWLLAESAYAMGKPLDASQELLGQSWRRFNDANERKQSELTDQATLDILAGAFGAAEKRFRDLSRAAAASGDSYDHAVPAWALSVLYRETGDMTRLAAVAGEFMRRKDAWASDIGGGELPIATDVEPEMLGALRRAGKLSASDFVARRDAWTARWAQQVPPAYLGYVWIYGYAATAETREDAEAAIAMLPKYAPLPWYRPAMLADAIIGRAYLLAGRTDEALPLLERATRACNVFDDPFRTVAAYAWLGGARERAGDQAGACRAYGEVVRRWGAAKPSSVTARDARARRAALHCL
jgi:eukaryotic-like serine/threonine-protein kinase